MYFSRYVLFLVQLSSEENREGADYERSGLNFAFICNEK
jgi:hypothetical protein